MNIGLEVANGCGGAKDFMSNLRNRPVMVKIPVGEESGEGWINYVGLVPRQHEEIFDVATRVDLRPGVKPANPGAEVPVRARGKHLLMPSWWPIGRCQNLSRKARYDQQDRR